MATNSDFHRSMIQNRVRWLLQAPCPRALISEPIEEQFVQDHGVAGNQLLALQSVDDEARCGVEVEAGELLGDEIEPLYGAA